MALVKEFRELSKSEVLLTDEEILKVKVKLDWLDGDDTDASIARAQLKKVVEWLDTLEFYDDWGGESGKALRDHIKQALLKEVSDGNNEVS